MKIHCVDCGKQFVPEVLPPHLVTLANGQKAMACNSIRSPWCEQCESRNDNERENEH